MSTALATIGRADGKQTVTFRINPNSVDWNFQINHTVIDTLGGRVVQVLGATLSDMQIRGSYGEDRAKPGVAKGTDDGPGRSWRLAEAFVKQIESLAEYQANNPVPMTSRPVDPGKVNPFLRFTFPMYGWDFLCYVKDIADPDGGSITHKTGKFSYEYVLTLFLVQDNSSLNILQGKAAQAADDYIARISQGISWDRATVGKYSGGSVASAMLGSAVPPDPGTNPGSTDGSPSTPTPATPQLAPILAGSTTPTPTNHNPLAAP
jgi:hypothetical protein